MPRLSIRKALLFGFHLRVVVQAEESSILKSAKVVTSTVCCYDPDGFLHGSFKSFIQANGVHYEDIEVEFNLP